MGVQKTIKKYLSCNGRNLSRGFIRDSATIQNRKGRVRSHRRLAIVLRLIAAKKGRHEMLLAFCYLFTTETNTYFFGDFGSVYSFTTNSLTHSSLSGFFAHS